jgi:hypothetical protein
MPRYFFHLECKSVVANDNKGREFSCLAEAHFHAQIMIRKTESHVLDDENDSARWIIRVTNAEDDVEMIVFFPVKRPRQPRRNVSAPLESYKHPR